jgi:hypothetical protein
MAGELLIPIAFFAFLAAVILVPIWLRERTRQSAHQLLSQALEKGQTLDPTLLRQLTEGGKAQSQPDRPRRTLGSGVVLLALALGFLAASFMSGDFTGGGMMTAATILGALGVAFILLALVDYSAKKKDQ